MIRVFRLPGIIAAIAALFFTAACGPPGPAAPPAPGDAPVEDAPQEGVVDDGAEVAPEPTSAPVVRLLADDLKLAAGECTRLSWETSDALRVYMDGEGVEHIGEKEVCPSETANYSLRVLYDGDAEAEREVTIEVTTPTEAPTDVPPPTAIPATRAPVTAEPTAAPTAAMSISFSPANGVYEIPKKDLCTSVSWQTTGVTAVQLERNADGRRDVEPSGTEEACFGDKEVKYTLWFKLPDGNEDHRELVIKRDD